ncbi:MAG: hypothetical protein ACI4D8_07030 [Wujia sp.]
MNSKKWLICWFGMVITALVLIACLVYNLDPYLHYHKPYTDKYYYTLDNQRSQNNGIIKRFEYDAIITGTSMTENFMTTELDELFGVDSIKVTYSAGTYKEINDNLKIALEINPELKLIVRCLDMNYFFDSADKMRSDLGEFPTYLYDDNIFNDVNYIYNRDVLFTRIHEMLSSEEKGITTFNEYTNWQFQYDYGRKAVNPTGMVNSEPDEWTHLTEEDIAIITENINENVLSLVKEYPDVDFYYFFPPYSIVWWNQLVSDGEIYRQLEAERYIIEQLLPYDNVHLYSFNNRTDITTNLNNYKDDIHYGQWVNSLILKWMHDGQYLLTQDNYMEYLEEELSFYLACDYAGYNQQEDYESDLYAGALTNKELTGADSISIIPDNADVISDSDTELIGASFTLNDISAYNYMVFYGKKIGNEGTPGVCIYGDNGELLTDWSLSCMDISAGWHMYVIELPANEDKIKITVEGRTETDGEEKPVFCFKDLMIY